MKFTILGEKVDGRIKNQLDLICNELKSSIPGIRSIILAGSFGYGEGPVKIVKDKIYPFNDYDIYAITERHLSKAKTDEIASKAANKLGLKGIKYFYDFKKEEQTLEKNFYIDLKCMTISELRKVLPRLRFYKFKKFTTILYGEDLRWMIPEFSLNQIPLSEPAKLLLDRISQMIEYYSTEKNYDDEFLTYIIQQAYAAMSTSLALLSRSYSPSYRQTADFVTEYYSKNFPDLCLRIQKYINWRLNPQKLPHKNTKEAWLTCANDLIEVTKYFFSKFLNKDIQTTDQLSKEILGMASKFYTPYINYIQQRKTKLNLSFLIKCFFPILSFYLKYKYHKRIGAKYRRVYFNKSTPDAYIFASAPYILSPDNQEYIEKAREILGKVYPVKSKNWEELSLEYAKAYIAYFLQSLG